MCEKCGSGKRGEEHLDRKTVPVAKGGARLKNCKTILLSGCCIGI